MSTVLFSLKNISKIYGKLKETKVKAVNDVSFDIKEGDFAAIVGPSGSGKSTLLNIMSGLDHPSSGEVMLGDSLISGLTSKELSAFRRDNIGIIFQAYNLIPVLTVLENIEFVMMLQKIEPDNRKERVLELLDEVGLNGLEDRYPNELSGGQQQRVAIARALAAKPKIIIADEPTANLDSHTASELLDLMEDLNSKHKTTFIFSTHDKMIMERAKTLITLRDGEIVAND